MGTGRESNGDGYPSSHAACKADASALQAAAAGIEPVADINPALPKPTGDSKSHVVVQGRVWQDLNASDYYGFKRRIVPKVRASYRRLASQNISQ